jgi:DNA repair protein RadC
MLDVMSWPTPDSDDAAGGVLNEPDPRFERRWPVPGKRSFAKRALSATRDVFEVIVGEREARRLWPKYPKRPLNFFTEDGKPHYFGHRQRLRERFLGAGPQSLADYELLELLLFNAIPKVDVKPLAKKLIETFGTLDAVIAAPESRLKKVAGVDEWVVLQLRIVGAYAERLAAIRIADRCVIASWDATIAYCRTIMAHRDREQLRVLYLDQRNHLIEDAQLGEGTINTVAVYPREIVRRAVEINAVGLVMLHNHPSGDPDPSEADIKMTAKVKEACDTLGLRLYDHVVIGRGSEASFMTMGLLR